MRIASFFALFLAANLGLVVGAACGSMDSDGTVVGPRFETQVTDLLTGEPVAGARLEEFATNNVQVTDADGFAVVSLDNDVGVLRHSRSGMLVTYVGVTREVWEAFNRADRSFSSAMIEQGEFENTFEGPTTNFSALLIYAYYADFEPAQDIVFNVFQKFSPSVARQGDGRFGESSTPGADGLILFPQVPSDPLVTSTTRCVGLTSSIPIEVQTLNTVVFICDRE